jgi:hypothetical protein
LPKGCKAWNPWDFGTNPAPQHEFCRPRANSYEKYDLDSSLRLGKWPLTAALG